MSDWFPLWACDIPDGSSADTSGKGWQDGDLRVQPDLSSCRRRTNWTILVGEIPLKQWSPYRDRPDLNQVASNQTVLPEISMVQLMPWG